MSEITLYGSSLSLYTGRARSYFIKAGLAYRETTPLTSHYQQNILPKAGGRQGIPTIETAEGEVIRDGAAIIDHYEDRNVQGDWPGKQSGSLALVWLVQAVWRLLVLAMNKLSVINNDIKRNRS